ncbi:DUF2283 domain-containing protein [Salinithrix halophila]|uniref:DUF2283 domain-containing protein n=2 Tax=Salinithrix halophila TaxID=1485204 RepID=A0ABV8JGR7_9BACL
MSTITFDTEAELAYLYLVQSSTRGIVSVTEDLDEESDLMLDFDKSGRIIGIEFFGSTALQLKSLANIKGILTKERKGDQSSYSFRLSDKKPERSIEKNGLIFYFSGKTNDFLGFDIVDIKLYGEKVLDSITTFP